MAAALARTLTQILFWLLFCQGLACVLASPMYYNTHPSLSLSPLRSHVAIRANVVFNNATGELQVFDPVTRQLIPQGLASDGSGDDFSSPALIWLVFCFVVGIPMALAGIRGWRLTTGVGIGLAGAVCSWAAFINTVNAVGISDIPLSLIVLGFFLLGFLIGAFDIGRTGGVALLGVTGGLAVGVRIMLLRRNLLLSGDNLFAVAWVLIALLGLGGGLVMIWWQRAGIAFASASVGTFLSFLGIDLVTHRQAGMSRGLRFLFDRNSSHIADIMTNKYNPPASTYVLLALSLVLTPALAYAQHRVFIKYPFSRWSRPKDVPSGSGSGPDVPAVGARTQAEKRSTYLGSKLRSMSRFSL